ncbi:hypothetical protein [Prosthecobacter sp.]|uniref:hypothetical protein n=1 Tax=Prosthecobacter sp. TaxID=1965333 RepID=UPI0037836820
MSRVLWLGVVLWVAGCGRSEREDAAVAPAVEGADVAAEAVAQHEAAPAAEDKPARPVAVTEAEGATAAARTPMPDAAPQTRAGGGAELMLTPELESSVVTVRVVVPGRMMREHSGVMLRADAFTPPVPLESKLRYATAVLPEFDEAVLRGEGRRLFVLRQKVDQFNKVFVMSRLAKLASFDAASHVAVLQFPDDFPYRLEEGGVEAASADAAGRAMAEKETVWLLQGMVNQDQEKQTAALPVGVEKSGLSAVMDVSLLRAEMTAEGLRLAEGQKPAREPFSNSQSRTNVSAVLAGDGRLLGFARPGTKPDVRLFEKVALPDVMGRQMRYEIVSVETLEADGHSKSLGFYHVRVKGRLHDPLGDFRSVKAVVRNLARAEDFTPAADLKANQPAMEHDGGNPPHVSMKEDGSCDLYLQMPQGAEISYQVLQLELMRPEYEVVFRTAPFLVVTKRRGAGLYHTVAGAPGAAGAGTGAGAVPPEAGGGQPGVMELTTESPIALGVPICEGREVLIKLKGAPYWKRLSLGERKWLPLPVPQEELSYCMLAGNKDALFVLDPGRGELRRYHAGTLALEKTAHLPDGISYHSVAAGCLTDDGPLAVSGDRGVLACDPRELTAYMIGNLAGAHDLKLPVTMFFRSSGDGRAVWGRSPDEHTLGAANYCYEGVMNGFGKVAVGFHQPRAGAEATVARAVSWGKSMGGDSTDTPLTTTAGHYVVERAQSGRDGVKTVHPRCSFYSMYADAPWAVLDLPEAADVPLGEWGTFGERLWLDPVSLTFALWHAEKTITLHTLDRAALPQPPEPVLLNYPDCHVCRADGFHFKPLVLGGSGAVTVTDAPPGLTVGADGTLDWLPPEEMEGMSTVFFLRLGGSTTGQGTQIQMELSVAGRPPAVAVPVKLDVKAAEVAAAAAGNARSSTPVMQLKSHFYNSDRPIMEVLPGLTDYLGLMLKDRTLQLLSVKDWKVAGSLALPATTAAFPAGDVVFTYNTITRELLRHSLPDFAVTHRLTVPAGSGLRGLAVGDRPQGPLTLVLSSMVKILTPKGQVAGERVEERAQILDKETLDPARWAQHKPRTDPKRIDILTRPPTVVHVPFGEKLPLSVPCSADGRLVSFPEGLLMISPGLTVDYLYPNRVFNYSFNPGPPAATPTADRLYVSGEMRLGGGRTGVRFGTDTPCTLSRCGNYVARVKGELDSRLQIRLKSADDGRDLLTVAGVEILKLYDGEEDYQRKVLSAQGDKNLLAVLSKGGFNLQAIELDVAAAVKITDPQAAFVTSHPFPIVAEGRTLDYDVTVSNPAAVTKYELRDPPQGALITPLGHVSYRAPTTLKESKEELISVVIHYKTGDVTLHQIPVYVIAVGAMTKGGK